VSHLERLRADHAPAVLDFETANRSYFALSITDRGDEFFDRFVEGINALLEAQERGEDAYYVLVADDGSVLGRFNLYFVADGVANLGYRVAQQVAGRGVATATVRDLLPLAASRHGITKLKAAASDENVASRRVLINNGFTFVEPADPADLGGKRGSWFERDITAV
jgi:ribosomal-protein-alanine N-acetyltransferase